MMFINAIRGLWALLTWCAQPPRQPPRPPAITQPVEPRPPLFDPAEAPATDLGFTYTFIDADTDTDPDISDTTPAPLVVSQPDGPDQALVQYHLVDQLDPLPHQALVRLCIRWKCHVKVTASAWWVFAPGDPPAPVCKLPRNGLSAADALRDIMAISGAFEAGHQEAHRAARALMGHGVKARPPLADPAPDPDKLRLADAMTAWTPKPPDELA